MGSLKLFVVSPFSLLVILLQVFCGGSGDVSVLFSFLFCCVHVLHVPMCV